MVIYEDYGVNGLGVPLTRAYSDQDMMIERGGVAYTEAIDPTEARREYTETDIPIETEDEATEDDFVAALGEMGVILND